MEINEIKERIAKKEAAIEKAKKLFDKYTAGLDDKARELIKASTENRSLYRAEVVPYLDANWPGSRDANGYREAGWGYGVKGRDVEAARSNWDKVVEGEVTLTKYKNQLNAAEVKANKLSQAKIQVIWEFLNQWEEKVVEYVKENISELELAREAKTNFYNFVEDYNMLNKLPEEARRKLHATWSIDRSFSRELYDTVPDYAKAIDLYREWKRHENNVDDLTYNFYSYRTKTLNEAGLRELLDKEKDAKYLDMIEKVTKITGEITDASALRIGYKGDINGFIIGKEGKCSLETIGAGGWNANYINPETGRHGQRYHFRTLIHKIK